MNENSYVKNAIIKLVDEFYELSSRLDNFDRLKILYWYLQGEIKEMESCLCNKNSTSKTKLGIEEA